MARLPHVQNEASGHKLGPGSLTSLVGLLKRFDELSTSRPIRSGVPQGSLFGPEVFILFTTDILPLPHTRLAIYGDDTVLYITSNTFICGCLQHSVNETVEWAQRWRLSFNSSKCEAIRFSTNRNPPPIACIYICTYQRFKMFLTIQ